MPPITPPASKESAIREGLIQHLATRSGLNWRHARVNVPDADVPVAGVFVDSIDPGDGGNASRDDFRLILRIAILASNADDAMFTLLDWRGWLRQEMTMIRNEGLSGTYRGVTLAHAIRDISPAGKFFVGEERVTHRADLGDLATVSLRMPYSFFLEYHRDPLLGFPSIS